MNDHLSSELEKVSFSEPVASKSSLKKQAAAAEKEKRRLETQARLQAEHESKNEPDFSVTFYGRLPLLQSQERTNKQWTSIDNLSASMSDSLVRVRGRLHHSRGTGKQVFVILREAFHTVQTLAFVDGEYISRQMVKFITSIPKESIVEVEGFVKLVQDRIEACSQDKLEIHIRKFWVINEAKHRLPISIEDASRPEEDSSELVDGVIPSYNRVNLDTRLDHRIIDLRTVTNQAIFRVSSAINEIFREFFNANKFIEIHSPKIMSAASEGGASVFKINYFKGEAFLAQSPQFAKQMAICADFDRVFEVAPVFRAENSLTHRHMTEFTGVDMEMTFKEHYHEVLETLCEMLVYLFDQLQKRCKTELDTIRHQYPFEDLKYPKKTLVLEFSQGIQLLRENGVNIGDFDDFNTAQEKFLGKLVKEKYNTDFYVLDKFPLNVRPFYTMPNPHDPLYSNSYDFFIRGEEILSGAQRIHDYDMLVQSARDHQIEPSSIESYLEAFKYGVPPHAGGGIGLERVVMLYLGLGNIRKSSLFPRDPKRLTP